MQRRSLGAMWWCCCLAVVVPGVLCVSTDGLLPYGLESGDSTLGRAQSSSPGVSLGSFTFFGETQSTAYVNADGAISFGGPLSNGGPPTDLAPPRGIGVVAPFWGDVDTGSTGNVFYRSSRDRVLLEQVAGIVSTSFQNVSDPPLNSLFIVTWDQVAAQGRLVSESNTFQCVLAFHDPDLGNSSSPADQDIPSFVLFLYKDGAMQWSKAGGEMGGYAAVEISNGDRSGLVLPTSLTEEVLEVVGSSNTGVTGQWLFRVDSSEVLLPVPLIGLEQVEYSVQENAESVMICTKIHAGELSQTVTVNVAINGQFFTQLNFLPLGLTQHCVEVSFLDDNMVEFSETIVLSLTAVPEDYVTLLPSDGVIHIIDDDEVSVGLEASQYTVGESEGQVQVCAVVRGLGQSQNLLARLQTSNDLARSPRDYRKVNQQFTFEPAGTARQCVNITIRDDNVAEYNETFNVSLTMEGDTTAVVLTSTAVVTILDNDIVRVMGLNSSGAEEGKMGLVCTRLDSMVERNVIVTVTFTDVSARVGEHYVLTSSPILTYANTYECVHITAIDNRDYDVGGRTFMATLTSNDSTVVFENPNLVFHIRDNDAHRVWIGFNNSVVTVSEDDVQFSVCASLTKGHIGEGAYIDVKMTTSVDISTGIFESAAEIGKDYEMAERIVRFSPESPGSMCLTVQVISDDILEDSETFVVGLKKVDSSQAYTLYPPRQSIVMEDRNSITATVEQTVAKVVETNRASATVCVIVEGEREIDVEFTATPHADNATAGKDYVSGAKEIVVPSSDTRGCIDFRIRNDRLYEHQYETFHIELTSADPQRVHLNESRMDIFIEDKDVIILRPFESVELSTVNESNSIGQYCAIIEGELDEGVEIMIEFYTENSTALAWEDYRPFRKEEFLSADNITNRGGNQISSFCSPFFPMEDDIVEGTQTFFVVMTPISDRVAPYLEGDDRIEVHILDNDVARVVPSPGEYHVLEGSGYVTVCATMFGLTEQDVIVNFTSADGTAQENLDYSLRDSYLLFPSYLKTYGRFTEHFRVRNPNTTVCTNVTILDDDITEEVVNKTFTIRFNSTSLPSKQLKFESDVLITIEDDDYVTLSLQQSPLVVGEGDGQVNIELSLVGEADFSILASMRTRPIAGDLSATPDVDYSTTEDTIELPRRGEPPLVSQLSVAIREDSILEDRERFEVVLSSSSPRVMLGEPSTATVWIEDNDYADIGLENPEIRVLEDAGRVSVCTGLYNPTAKTIAVNVSTEPISATAGMDYSAPASQLEFQPSTESYQRVCVHFDLLDDVVLEPVETFNVSISTTEPRVNVNPSAGIVSIVDDDGVNVGLVRSEFQVEEGEGGEVRVCVQLKGVTATEVEVNLRTEEDTAHAGRDFVNTSRHIVFPPSFDGNQTVCTNFSFLPDNIVEDTERFFIHLVTTADSSDRVQVGANRARVLITDEDTVSVDFEQFSYRVAEELGVVSVCVQLGEVVERRIDVLVTTGARGDTARPHIDFTNVDAQFAFDSRASTRLCVNISVMDDSLLEDEEYFTVYLYIPADPAVYISSTPDSSISIATVAITDNDYVSVGILSSGEDDAVQESAGVVSVCAQLSSATGKTVTVDLTSYPGTAQAGVDYIPPTSNITFLPSFEMSQIECVDVEIVDDDILESVETFHLAISSSVPRVNIAEGEGESTVRVVDGDGVRVDLVQGEYEVEEVKGAEVEVCVLLTGVIEREVEVVLSTMADSAQADVDFTNESRVVTFYPSPASNQTICSPFTILEDTTVEDTESFFVTLSSRDSFVTSDTTQVIVSILDLDQVSVEFQHPVYFVREERGDVSVCVVLGEMVEREISVQLTTGALTAQPDTDFTPVDTQLTFQPRNTTQQCTSIPILNDAIFEDDETFLVSLLGSDSALYTAGNGSQAVVVIADNDTVAVTLAQSVYQVEEREGAEVEVCVTLMGVLEREIQLELHSISDTAKAGIDFDYAQRFVTFNASPSNKQTKCTTFGIIDDDFVENEESFIVHLTTTERRMLVENGEARISISDADTVTVDFEQPVYTVREGDGKVSVCVVLGEEVQRNITVRLTTAGDINSHSGDIDPSLRAEPQSDFTDVDTEITFQPSNATRKCASIPVLDDDVLEYDEQFIIDVLSFDSSVRLGGSNATDGRVDIQGLVVIVNDDSVRVGMERERYSVEEKEREIRVCLVVEGQLERSVTVTMQTRSGNGISDVLDYVPTTQALTLDGSGVLTESERCMRVAVLDDRSVEKNESFTVQLSSPLESSGALTLHPKSASVVIIDDDVLCVSDVTVSPRGTYKWNQTKPGLKELKCEFGAAGMARRRCSENGVWEKVNVTECSAKLDILFESLDNLPFSCENFHELFLGVRQATEEGDHGEFYLSVVATYFSNFAKVDSYKVDEQTCFGTDSFTIGVKILDQLHNWPLSILWSNSTAIIGDFEAVSETFVASPASESKVISEKNMAFSSVRLPKTNLEKNGISMTFSTGKSSISVASEVRTGSSVLGSITLPSSLFETLSAESDVIGVWFTLYRKGSFFPVLGNSSLSTPVISATVGKHHVSDLQDPVVFSLQLFNKSVTKANCVYLEDKETDGPDEDSEELPYWKIEDPASVKNGSVTCKFDHLTNFAGIRDVPTLVEAPRRTRPSLPMNITSTLGVMLALLPLLLTIVLLLAISKIRRRRTTALRVQLCLSLILLTLAYTGHMIMDYTDTLPQDISVTCSVISAFTHYFTISSLLWLGAEVFLMFRKLVIGHRLGDVTNIFFVALSIAFWLIPFPLMALPAVMNQDWTVTENQYCFISNDLVLLITFLIPAGLTVVVNVTLYLAVLFVFVKHDCRRQSEKVKLEKKKSEKAKLEKRKSGRRTTTKVLLNTPAMSILFLLAWIFASFTFITSEASLAFHLLSAIFATLLGWLVFVYFVLMAKRTRKAVHETFCGKEKLPRPPRVISMESFERMSGMEDSDSDSDYPDKEKKYNEFDIYLERKKSALIEQQFTIAFKADESTSVKSSSAKGTPLFSPKTAHSFSPYTQLVHESTFSASEKPKTGPEETDGAPRSTSQKDNGSGPGSSSLQYEATCKDVREDSEEPFLEKVAAVVADVDREDSTVRVTPAGQEDNTHSP